MKALLNLVFSFVYLVVLGSQFIVVWAYVVPMLFLIFSGNPDGETLGWLLTIPFALAFLWHWLVMWVNWESAVCKVWWRWQI